LPHDNIEEDADFVAAYTEIARAYVASAASLGYSQDPQTYDNAMDRFDADCWNEAIQSELDSLKKIGTFEELDVIPQGHKAINAKLVFKIKRHIDRTIERYKVHLVAKGYYQQPGIDFDETFALVVKLTSIRVLCALAVRLGLHFDHLDVETAFLNGPLDVELYLQFLKGCGDYSGKVVKLLRSIYGLRQVS